MCFEALVDPRQWPAEACCSRPSARGAAGALATASCTDRTAERAFHTALQL
jgi:hypothetical protein